MKVQPNEVRQRLNFIDRTIGCAAQACHSDTTVSTELKEFIDQLCLRTNHARQALISDDAKSIRQSVHDLEHLSHCAKDVIGPGDNVSYDVKCAVILAHLELSALKYQLD